VDVVLTFLQYERCAGIPVEGSNEWRIKIGTDSLDPTKLIRLIETKGDDAATYDAITAHMQDSLSQGRGDLPWWELLLINVRVNKQMWKFLWFILFGEMIVFILRGSNCLYDS
jgi:hypothetical protein